ncbi:site-specific integrase [Sulfuricella sp.]|uniref:site-specific integrase n=1 Tax=Sulfuricella sp. TaxID=2099377 RepID=UPI002C0A3784|nr:site-specific integrase [Sulfuricella sp.]HUX64345.1 site-specific integrase [Sulfuricella sp.]
MATIKQRDSGWWQAIIRRKGYPNHSKTFEYHDEAKAWARDIESEMDKGLFLDRREADKNTLGAILTRYRDEVAMQHKGGDVEIIRINVLLNDQIAHYKMSALSGAALSDWISRRQTVVKSATVRRELDIISQAITKARRAWGVHLSENPVSLIERPKPAKARDRRLSEAEESALLSALEDHAGHGKKYRQGTRNPWIKPLVMLALETAMRRGELLDLEWRYVDLARCFVHLPETKNGSARDVPLSTHALAILSALPRSITGKVFPVTANAVHGAWDRAVARAQSDYEKECQAKGIRPLAGFMDNLRFHDLRHEATSRLAEKLSNILKLSSVTGHKDLRMLKRYYHPRAEDLAKELG